MNETEFVEVVARIKELWAAPSFHRDWNEANQRITFKMLSTFAQHAVLDCIENYRYDDPDGREPKFKEIAAKLWAVRKTREGQKSSEGASSLPSWPTIAAWADRKSDDDLDHLWQNVARLYSDTANVHDILWPLLNGCDRRSGAHLTLCWAVEHDVPLTFRRGSDEWHVAMDEHDRNERQKSVAAGAVIETRKRGGAMLPLGKE